MRHGASPDSASFDCVIDIAAPPESVYAAFFSREAPDEVGRLREQPAAAR
jgi:hypothetical protein